MRVQALLDRLADMLSGSRMLLLVNYRPEYSHRWGDKAWCSQLRLESLGDDSADEMLSAILGDTQSLAPLKELIVTTTGGVPFFMEETVRALFDEGALERQDGTVRLVRLLDSLRIPPTVQAILAARIDRLHNDEKNLLQTLAILGREFVLRLARAVAGKSEDELERLIARLQLGEFVYEQPSILDVEYIFKHALTQEVAYNSVLLERRKRLHEHVGHAIETIYADLARRSPRRTRPSFFAQRQPGEGRRVSAPCRGTQALARGALPQAIRDFEQTLALLKASRAAKIAMRWNCNSSIPRHGLHRCSRLRSTRSRSCLRARAELCERIGQPPQLFAVVWGNFAWRVVRGEMGLSMDLAREAIGLAERFDDPGIWMEALFLLGLTLFYRGDFVGALAQYEKALSHYDDRERTAVWASHVGEDAGVTHRCYLALALWQLGYPKQALAGEPRDAKLARSDRPPL